VFEPEPLFKMQNFKNYLQVAHLGYKITIMYQIRAVNPTDLDVDRLHAHTNIAVYFYNLIYLKYYIMYTFLSYIIMIDNFRVNNNLPYR